PRPQVVIDLAKGRLRQRAQRLARNHQHILAEHLLDPHTLGRDLPVGRGVRPERKQRRVLVGWNGLLLVGKGGRGVHGWLVGWGRKRLKTSAIGAVLSIFRRKEREPIAIKDCRCRGPARREVRP